jgi:hypothetical protein
MDNSAKPINWYLTLAERGEFVAKTARTIAQSLAASTITSERLTSICQSLDRYARDFEAMRARLDADTKEEFLLSAAKTIGDTLITVRTAVNDRIVEMQSGPDQTATAKLEAMRTSLLSET